METMQAWIRQQNIQRFEAQLTKTIDNRDRKILEQLLRREEEALARLMAEHESITPAEKDESRHR